MRLRNIVIFGLVAVLLQGLIIYGTLKTKDNFYVRSGDGETYVAVESRHGASSVKAFGPNGVAVLSSTEDGPPSIGVYDLRGNMTGVRGKEFVYVDKDGTKKVLDVHSLGNDEAEKKQSQRIDAMARDITSMKLEIKKLNEAVERLSEPTGAAGP